MMEDKNKSMEKLHFSVRIHAPKEKVWDTMLGEESYREWANVFHEGSYYQGSWEEGSKILFLGPEGSGMVSKVVQNKPYAFVSLEHLGFVKDGVEDIDSEEIKAMAGAHEDYTFQETDGITEVGVDLDISNEYKAMFEDMWPKALLKLKEIAERNSR